MSVGGSWIDPNNYQVPKNQYALRNRQGKQAFVKENEKNYLCKKGLNL